MPDIFNDIDPLNFMPPVEPLGGWTPVTCSFDSHKWTMEIEEGRINITCVDPCPSEPYTYDPSGPTPTCLAPWESEDFFSGEAIPVRLTFCDESTPASWLGEAEYGFYIEVAVDKPDEA